MIIGSMSMLSSAATRVMMALRSSETGFVPALTLTLVVVRLDASPLPGVIVSQSTSLFAVHEMSVLRVNCFIPPSDV